MINKKRTAGILLGVVITLSATYSLAEVKTSPPCVQDNACPSIKCPADPARMNDRIKSALDSLVKDGTLSQEQSNAVINAFEAKMAQFEKERQKLKNEEPSNDKNGRQRHKFPGKKHSVLKDLVDDGVITKEQADAIRKAIRSLHEDTKNQG